MKRYVTSICMGVFVLSMIGMAHANVITMEAGDRFADHGFNTTSGIHDNLFANPYSTSYAGYNTVRTSGDYVAFQYIDGSAVTIGGIGTYNYNGAWWAAAWDSSQTLTLEGYLNGTLLYSTTNTIYQSVKTWIQSDFIGIDELRISTSSQQAAFDDWTYNASSVPEPATLALLGLGLFGLGFNGRKRIR